MLDGVSASVPAGAQVTWSVYRNGPGELGFGSVHGPLGPQWPTLPVHGYRVSQAAGHPERGASWLVASVHASTPGVYKLSNIKVKYRSGRHVRRSDAHTFVCVLVAGAEDEQRFTDQMNNVTDLSSVDSAVADLERCANPDVMG